MDNTEKYLKATGQSLQDLYSGLRQYGPEKIDQLVDQCLNENKKIVWKTRLVDGQNVGLVDYDLQKL